MGMCKPQHNDKCMFFTVLQLKPGCSSVSALNIVYQRNGDGEAKSPACRAGVCEAVLHTLKQGTRFPAQVITEYLCDSLLVINDAF